MMYTVFRVTAAADKIPELASLGEAMNAVRPGTFVEMRGRGDGFAVELCGSDHWLEHLTEIGRFVDAFGKLLRPVVQSWVMGTIDVAIEPKDRGSARFVFVLDWDNSLLADIAAAGLRLEVSVY